ncbi:hypothetical protein GCM10009525_21460 [Streptosporangium amethystogenes subsp. fukuiense]
MAPSRSWVETLGGRLRVVVDFERRRIAGSPKESPACRGYRRTISVIQMGANGDVQPGEVG